MSRLLFHGMNKIAIILAANAFAFMSVLPGAGGQSAAAASMREQIEVDWLRQAQAWQAQAWQGKSSPTQADAAGAVDGVKNGKYAFHTEKEPNPWWQVDLGEPLPIARVVVFNRLDYAPGLHNADNLLILISDDGKQWKQICENQGKHFGGISGAPPLEVKFREGEVRARFVRLQIPSAKPIYLHLDEVEIYGPSDPAKNLALNRPADQSSVSQWSTAKTVRAASPPVSQNAGDARQEASFDKPIRHFVERGRLLAADLKLAGVDTAPFEREFAEATARLDGGASTDTQQQIYFKVRWALRRLAFRNPLLNIERLLFVKRFTQETYPDVCLNHMPWVSRPGGDLCILTLAGPEGAPQIRTILNGALGPGHVHGADLWWNVDRVVFGYAKARSAQPPEGWLDRRKSFDLRRSEEPIHLFEIGVDGRGLRQLTSGEWSDLDPAYLPNGDVAFVSERCVTSLQCNEYNKDETSCNLYVMRSDGSGVRRMSVSKDGDYLPHTLDDGTLVYTRWEYHERSWAFIQSLWTIRPDGTQADAIFKQHFTDPWALEDARSIPGAGGVRLAAIAAGHHTLAAGPVVIVTPGIGVNDARGIRIVTPGVKPPEGGMSGTPVEEGGVMDRGGYYMHPWPLSEKTFLVSYSFGLGKSGLASEIDPTGYALYLIDVFGTKELIYRDPDISCFMPLPLRPRLKPPVIPETITLTSDSATCAVSRIGFGSDGIAPERIRYLRVAEPIGWPYDNERGGQRYGEDHAAFEAPGKEKRNLVNWTPIRILGDVPVEKDGSAYFRLPVDTAVYFQLLDENRQELRRMRSFISFQPGEARACVGCHESRAMAPAPEGGAASSLAMRRAPSAPIPAPWGDRPISFLRDVQPVLDRNCVRCHSGLKPAGNLDFFGGLTSYDPLIAGYGYNRAFQTILDNQLVARSMARQQDSSITPPMAYGSHKSKLIADLAKKQHIDEVKLSEEDRLRLVIWIDANAPYHDGFENKRPVKPAYSLPGDRALADQIAVIHANRCSACHKAPEVSRLDWIDIRDPARSLFLAAPLAKDAGGSGKCGQVIYRDANDIDYRAILELVDAAVAKAWENPRRDLVTMMAFDRAIGNRTAKSRSIPRSSNEK
ncbi:MAG: discoidin domain-containing protein [Candidatus Sumerlaeota bacterium]|nr:discoidin domain-containing protein [Candidatus Sumerlaeota bacterium]